MSTEQGIQQQLATAQAQIQQLSQQLASERDAARQIQTQLQEQIEQQQRHITHLEIRTDQLQWIINHHQSEPLVEQEIRRIAKENCQFRQTLKAQEATYRHLFDCNPQPMWVYDLETLQFLAVNDATVAKYGYSRAEFLTMTIADMCPPEDVPLLLDNVRQVDSRLDLAGLWRHRLRNGQIIQVEIVSYALEFEGRQAELVMAQDVTDRIQAEQALRRSEERYRQLVELSPQLIWNADEQGHNIYASPRMCKYIGLPAARLMKLDWQTTIHPDDLEQVHNRWMESVQTGIPYETEYRLRRADGVYRWHLVQAVCVQHEQETQWFGMSTDIHDRKQAELALQDLNLFLEQKVAERTADLHRSQAELQAILNNSPAKIYVEDLEGRYIFVNQTFLNLFNCTQADILGKTSHEFFPPDIADAFRANDLLLLEKGDVQQFEEIGRVNGKERVYLSNKFLLRNDQDEVYAVCGMSTDITHLKEIETKLKRQLAAIEAAVDGIAILQDNSFLYLNRAHLKLFGYSQAEELIGQPWMVLYGPDEVDQFEQEIMPIVARDGTWVGEVTATRKDGTTFDQRVSLSLTEDGLLICVCENISGQKAARQALRDSQSFLQTVLETAPVAIFWKDLQGVYQGANTKTAEVFGLTSTIDLINHTDAQLVWSPEVVETIRAEDRQIIATQEPYLNIIQHLITTTGVEVWLEINKVPLCDDKGNIFGILGIAQDVTQRKQTELALQDLTDRLTFALQAGAFGTWDWDMVHEATWDERMYEIYGLQDLERASLYQDWRDRVHPDDITQVEAQLERAVRGEIPFNAEFRIWRTDGELRWVQALAQLQYDSQGIPIRMVGVNQDITDRKQVETALRESEQRYATLTQAAPVAIFRFDLEGRCVYINEYWCEMTGKLAAFAMGNSWIETIHPDDREHTQTMVQQWLQSGAVTPFHNEARILHDDGSVIWFYCQMLRETDTSGQPIGYVGTLTDITARKQAELALQDSETRFRQVFTSNVVGMMFADFSGRITDANDRFLDIVGYSRADLEANRINWVQITPPEHVETDQWVIDQLQRYGELHPFEKEYLRPDGSRVAVLIGVALLSETDGRCVCVVVDISDRKQAELKLQQTNQELARATRLKDEFLANMSHELRTPLNAILGMAEGLQEGVFGPLSDRQCRSLSIIERSGNHLLSLINDILDLSKIEAGQLELEVASVSVSLLCDSSLTFVKQQAHKKQLHLETRISPNLPDVYGDERRLRQVLINLLTNAVKFTPEGGRVTLSATYTPLTLEERAHNQDYVHPQGEPSATVGILALSVTDTGIGISSDNAKNLFQPFVQVDSALNRQHEGTGLGLALVKRTTEMHGGQVELTSEVGSGSCFTVRLPIIAIPSNSSPTADLTASIEATTPIDHATAPLILLAEDNDANITTITAYLKARGYSLILAKNGVEAVNLAKTASPDLILMDIQMPQLNGLEAIRQIRQIPDLGNVPIIAVTALAMPDDRDRCLSAGADEYISKPIRLKQLYHGIQTLLAK